MKLLARPVMILAICCSGALAQKSHFHWLVDAGGVTSGGNTQFTGGLTGGGVIADRKSVV